MFNFKLTAIVLIMCIFNNHIYLRSYMCILLAMQSLVEIIMQCPPVREPYPKTYPDPQVDSLLKINI